MLTADGGGGGIPFCTPDAPPEQLGGGAFRIEPDKIPGLINGLRTALNDLDVIRETAGQSIMLQPPGRDPYSADAMTNFANTMSGGSNAYIQAHMAYVDSIKQTIGNLEKLLKSTQAQEQATSSSLGSTGS
ncbi:hypothetical protein GCM10027047_35760 [Rhodococcus aerolatus]